MYKEMIINHVKRNESVIDFYVNLNKQFITYQIKMWIL